MTLTVPCLFGLEALVADEMRRLGLRDVRAENGRVHCDGTLADIAWGPFPRRILSPSSRG